MAKNNINIAIEFAVKNKYDSATFYEKWKGLDVYIAESNQSEDVQYIGYPFLIIVSNGKAQIATPEEILSIMGINTVVDENDSGEVL